jgi:hypothetical protein
MRSIRRDLEERLQEAQAEKQRISEQLNAHLRASDTKIETLTRMIAMEDERDNGPSRMLVHETQPIADFIVERVRHTPLNKEEIREALEKAGYLERVDAPGRVIHATLVNVERGGRILQRDDGRYVASDAVSFDGASTTATPSSPGGVPLPPGLFGRK